MIYCDFTKLNSLFEISSTITGDWITEYDICPSEGQRSFTTGMTHTDEWKNLMSDKHSGDKNPFYGKKHSEDSKLMMSESAKRRSDEWKVKQQNRKTIYHYNTPDGKSLVIKGSLNKFCKENGLNTGAMSKVHRGEASHHKGYTL